MSNNAAVTTDGGEIGRAQALQALACGIAPHTDMNPVLLKPETDVGCQVVVQGRRMATVRAREYAALKPQLMAPVLESFRRLKSTHDLVIVEGAGSPAEVNLRGGDIANMGFACAANVPVVLTGDIDRGGVIAQIVGTQAVIAPEDAAMIQGFLINKFRGDPSLFDDGYRLIEQHTGWRGFGVLPWFAQAHLLLPKMRWTLAAGPRAGEDRGSGPVPHRQFRRSGPAGPGARHRSGDDPPRRGDPGRHHAGHHAGQQEHARRSGLLRAQGGMWTLPPMSGAGPCAGHLRRVSDAGPDGQRSPGWRASGTRRVWACWTWAPPCMPTSI
jgi:hypothetical protein